MFCRLTAMDDRGEVLCRWAGAAIADDDIAMVEGVVAPNTIGSASAEESPTASKANLSKACCGHSHCTYDGLASEAAHARASIPSRAPAIVAVLVAHVSIALNSRDGKDHRLSRHRHQSRSHPNARR